MRFCISIFFLALLTSSCVVNSTLLFSEADIEDSVNLLSNPGFAPQSMMAEEGLPGWNLHSKPHSSQKGVHLDPGVASEGDSSLKISASDREVSVVSDPFSVRRYGGYYAKVMVMSDSEEDLQVTLQMVTFRDDGKITNRFRKKERLKPGWNKLCVSAGFLRPGVTSGRISVIIPPFKDGDLWLDDAGCWEVHGFRID